MIHTSCGPYVVLYPNDNWKTMRPFAICYWVFGIVQINEEEQLTSAVAGAFQKIIEV